MAYKVNYYKLAKMKDGSIGNIPQGHGVVYTDSEIKIIEFVINKRLEEKKQICVVQSIEKIEGSCI